MKVVTVKAKYILSMFSYSVQVTKTDQLIFVRFEVSAIQSRCKKKFP